ncbi:MAG: NAD(P)H-dependent oxidoreductase [Candidatus Brockarchaeota archaeon]|nr:NAD(P)H-dependent oxidoreductase [Candidatus Brockarchaeota archaeon]
MKLLVLYDSRSGNTEEMAKAVARGAKKVEGSEVEVKKVDGFDAKSLEGYDAIIAGSPTYYGEMSGKLKAVFDDSVEIHGRLEGKVGAAFTSAGGTATGAETAILSILQAMLVHGMVVQGNSSDKHYGVASVGKPDEKTKKLCEELGERTAKLACRLLGR